MNRIKNLLIFIFLISFLCFVTLMPVTCPFRTVTGISCPACGMTRAFIYIFKLQFLEAVYQNILSIPVFIFILYTIIRLIVDIIKNQYTYIPNLIDFLGNNYIFILTILFISFLFNNLKI